jgi:glycosyltransferase involved in cell wall biosynthesis
MSKYKPKLRILVFAPSFLPVIGGAQLGIHEIYKRIGERHEVVILTPEQSETMHRDYVTKKDYVTGAYNTVRFKNTFESIKSSLFRNALAVTSLPYIQALKKLGGSERFDVINSHGIFPQGMAAIYAKRKMGIPLVLSLVGRSDVWESYKVPQRLYAKKVLKNADTITPITRYCLKGYSPQGNVTVIPYGVDTTEFSPARSSVNLRRKLGVSANGFLIFTVQRLALVKRVDVLIRIVSEVVKSHPEVILVIGGQGEEYENLQRLIKDLKLTKNIKLIGYISEKNLPNYFASADLFAFHSISETFGIVFAQAMACGLPIVSISSTCIPEVVHDKINGILVEPFDTKAFRDAIVKLIENKNLHKKMSVENRKRAVKEFDWNVIAAQYEQALLNVAERSH